MDTKLLTTQDVAEYFGVNKNIVTQKFCREGLKYIKLSQTDFRYNKKDVLEFEEQIKVSNKVDQFIDFGQFNVSTQKCKLKV